MMPSKKMRDSGLMWVDAEGYSAQLASRVGIPRRKAFDTYGKKLVGLPSWFVLLWYAIGAIGQAKRGQAKRVAQRAMNDKTFQLALEAAALAGYSAVLSFLDAQGYTRQSNKAGVP